MRLDLAVLTFGGLSVLALGLETGAVDVLRLHAATPAGGAPFPDLLSWMGRKVGGMNGTNVVAFSSIAGWLIAPFLLLASRHHRHLAALAVHPATVLLTVSGLGFAASALLLLFAALGRLAEHQRPPDLFLLASALAFLALSMPNFELVALAAASPLFLVAPKAMLRTHMTSFYLIVLLPAFCVLGLKAALGHMPAAPIESSASQAGVPAALALLPLAAFAPVRRAWRALLAIGILAAGIVLSGALGGFAGLVVSGLAAAFALRGRVPLGAELTAASAMVLAAPLI